MTTAGRRPAPGDPVAPWMAGAFGLNVRGAICVLGLSQNGAPAMEGLPQVDLEPVQATHHGGAQAVVAGGTGGLMIQSLTTGGHRMSGPGMGEAEIEPDAARVLIAPPPVDGWRWNRWLLGQVLPFVAALHGHELLHAGGVVVGDQAVAILGPSGHGKSTLVGALLEHGAEFLSDDVIAITPEPPAVLAHPGPGVLGLPTPQFHTAAPPTPLSAICLLEMGERDRVTEVSDVPPAGLLGNVYERVRRDPERLAGQLVLLADLAARARFMRVERGRRSDPQRLASALLTRLSG